MTTTDAMTADGLVSCKGSAARGNWNMRWKRPAASGVGNIKVNHSGFSRTTIIDTYIRDEKEYRLSSPLFQGLDMRPQKQANSIIYWPVERWEANEDRSRACHRRNDLELLEERYLNNDRGPPLLALGASTEEPHLCNVSQLQLQSHPLLRSGREREGSSFLHLVHAMMELAHQWFARIEGWRAFREQGNTPERPERVSNGLG